MKMNMSFAHIDCTLFPRDCAMRKSEFLGVLTWIRHSLDLVVTEEVKTWTEGIVGAQWNDSDWYVTDFVLLSSKEIYTSS